MNESPEVTSAPASAEAAGRALFVPSNALMRAFVSGLLGLGVSCDEQQAREESDPEESHEHDAERCESASDSPEDAVSSRADAEAEASLPEVEGSAGEVVEKELSTMDVQLSYNELTKLCDERQGYVSIHGSCSGVNMCRGFFYGDWDEESQLIEHSCSGVNGCSGLSCMTTEPEPEGGGLTGEEILKLDDAWFEERVGPYGAKSCRTCHIVSEFSEEKDDYVYDYSKLKVPVWASSGRNGTNWLERSAAYQEAVIAFGVQGISDEGVAYRNMVSYAKLFSKAEIKRVVEYMRSFDPKDITFKEIKLQPGKAE